MAIVKAIFITFYLFTFKTHASQAPTPATGFVDLHTHIASHLAYGIALSGGTPLDQPPEEEMNFEHAFKQQMYTKWLKESKTQIIVSAALVNVLGFSKDVAWKQVNEQMNFVEEFAKKNSEHFVLAKTPAEARAAIAQGKQVIVHALEGAEYLVDTPADALKLEQRGVAMVGPIHLVDNEYGGASILRGAKVLLNWKGALKRATSDKKRGLSKLGRKAVNHLMDIGIIVDAAHMSETSLEETLDIAEKRSVPIIMSHGNLRSIREEERALTDQQIRRIYSLGGLIGITSAKDLLHPLAKQKFTLPSDHCRETVDDYLLHYDHFNKLFKNSAPLGWASDFNGFVNHFKPKFGEEGCTKEGGKTLFDTKGLFHPGALPQVWSHMQTRGHSTTALDSSAERFLTIWEKVLAARK